VRARTALAAVVVVAVALGGASVGLVWAVHRSLVDGLVTAATDEAVAVSGLASARALPPRLPASMQVRAGVEVQVVDARGRVVSASTAVAGRPPVSAARPPVGVREVLRTPPLFGTDDDALDVATSVHARQGLLTVYAITSVQQEENSTHLLVLLLVGIVPVLAAVAGVLGWELAGRALRPVEEIRTELSEITTRDLHRRVPEPPFDDEIGRLARTVNEVLASLEQATDLQRQFVSDASHELRSPLAALLARVEVARAHPEIADWEVVTRVVVEEGARLSAIIDDLLLLARSDEGHLAPGHDPVDMDEIVLAEGRRLRAQQRVSVDLSRVGAGRVTGDFDQLRRVVRNLADNAERHAGTAVSFEVARRGGWVEVAVADDGPGIPPTQRKRVFVRFARLDSALENRTLQVLALVWAVVAAHGGSVSVTDAVATRTAAAPPAAPSAAPAATTRRAGARFVVRLPAAPG
jgi:signal transduction histidine kinase